MTEMAPLLGPIGTLVDHALGYAATGLEVFPVKPDKTPYTSQHNATTDAGTISAWWKQWPDALIGHRLAVDVVIVDVDPKHNGLVTWKALRDQHERITTRGHLSGRNDEGGHLWFRHVLGAGERWSTKALDAWARENGFGEQLGDGRRWTGGIDILHREHRYTILPPSLHPDTGQPYRWFTPTDEPIATMPFWLVELLVVAAPTPPEPRPVSTFTGESVIEWWKIRHTISDVLGAEGWDLVSGDGDSNGSQWRHPSATNAKSATVRDGRVYVFSPNTILEETAPGDAHGYDSFDLWTQYRHHGDQAAAVRAALDERDGPLPARETWDWMCPSTPSVALRRAETVELRSCLPDVFWDSREALSHIRVAAHGRSRSADAVLHTVLARVASQLDHRIDLPPIVGSAASINYFAALIGGSGAGKSSAVRTAKELTPPAASLRMADGIPLGSGEGLAETFMGEMVDPADPKGLKKIRGQVNWNVFVYADEGEALMSLGNRAGNTLMESLRRGWSGETLGQANAAADRRRIVYRGRYRLGLAIGFQPMKAGALLADHVGGTPQRFIWVSAVDPSIPDEAPEWPGELRWHVPSADVLAAHEAGREDGLTRFHFGVHDDIRRQIRVAGQAQSRGVVVPSELDAHALLHQLKAAALLAVLDGRLDVDLEDWALAGIVWETSCAVRDEVMALATADAERVEAASIGKYARREQAAQLARGNADEVIEQHARRVANWVHDGAHVEGFTRNELRNRLNSRARHLVDDVVVIALKRGWLMEREERFFPTDSRPS